MSNEAWFSWGIPVAALVLGALSLSIAWLSAWDFDRRYPNSPK